METQRMLDYFQYYSPRAPPFTVPPHLPLNFDLVPMQTSHFPLDRPSSAQEGYFCASPTSTRQRTAQACDKCRERKTKCSGEKPVCQRCANRGLICEYTCRAPRMRGFSAARLMSAATPPLDVEDEKQRIFLLPSHTGGYFSRSYPAITPHRSTGYVPSFAVSKHPSSSSLDLGAETRAYSVMRHPSWAELQPDIGGPQQWMSAPREPKIDYDLYPPSEHLQKRHNSLPNDVLHSTSSFLFKAQENPRYNNNCDHSSSYHYSTGRLADSSLSGSSGSSSPGYHSGSALSSSAPTPPFYSQEPSEDLAHLETFGGRVMDDHHHDTAGKGIYQNADVGSAKRPYCSKDAGVQEGWSMNENSITDSKQALRNLRSCDLWM